MGLQRRFPPMGPPCGYFAFKVVRGGCSGAALQVGETPYVAQSCSLELYLLMKVQIMHPSPGGGETPEGRTLRVQLCAELKDLKDSVIWS